ncbi:hypothetical protein L1049_023205 [Liquidambar formosana]|uniref:Uncharacterized protein n=1 Tax=Liquidambar formosana TaxID=63359 RepID=A0AAP0RDS7_LIQFO
MAGIGTLVDLLLFYTLERLLFNRMVGPMGLDSELVKKAMALWLMLEEIGHYDLTRIINSFDNQMIESLFKEALECCECIQPNAVEPAAEWDDSTVFVGLYDEPMNRRFFYYNREFMYKRFTHIFETVCEKIFSETAAVEVDESGTRPVVRPFGEGSSAQRSEAPSSQSNLNPDAVEFNPGETSEDSRTMFLTFSLGHPISREEIIQFFTINWGPVVQDVVIEQTRPGLQPLYGRIIFTTSLVIPRVLNGQVKAKFVVNRKHLWARIYVPRRRGTGRH